MEATKFNKMKRNLFKSPTRAYLSLFGSFLLCFVLGFYYSMGNSIPYLLSFLHNKVDRNITISSMTWTTSLCESAYSLFTIVGGFLIQRFGIRKTAFLGTIIISSFQGVSYFTIKSSFILFLLTYSVLTWCGGGFTYVSTIVAVSSWFPEKFGTYFGLVNAGWGIGGIVWIQIQTILINPENLQLNVTTDQNGYFMDENLLTRVPNALWETAAMFFVLNAMGSFILFCKPASSDDDSNKKDDRDKMSLKETLVKYLKRKELYLLWVIGFLLAMPSIYVFTYLKSFGMHIVNNDHLLTYAHSFVSSGTIFGKIIIGIICDKTSHKVALIVICLCLGPFIQLLTFCAYLPPTAFLITSSLCGFIAISAGSAAFCILPMCTVRIFDKNNSGEVSGLIMNCQFIGGLVSSAMFEPLQDILGWNWMFTLQLGISALALIVTLSLPNEKGGSSNGKNERNVEKLNVISTNFVQNSYPNGNCE